MKTLNIITHPYTVIISFFIIMISGQHIGGFYLLYLLLALPHGGDYAILAASGVALIIISHSNKRIKSSILQPIIALTGILILYTSIFIFFFNDKERYNFSTFYQLVPQITLIVFGLISLSFLSRKILQLYRISTRSRINRQP